MGKTLLLFFFEEGFTTSMLHKKRSSKDVL